MTEKEERALDLLKYMQSVMWDELSSNIRRALNGAWSIASEGTVQRIIWIAQEVDIHGPEKIDIPLLKSGVYEAVCDRAGVPAVIDLDLNRYEAHWGDYEMLAKAVPHIKSMRLHTFEPEEE